MRKVLIDANSVVVNVIEWSADSNYAPPDGCTLIADGDGAMIGATWDAATGTFAPPAPVTPPAPPPDAAQFAALQSAVQSLTLQVLTLATTGG